MSIAYPKSVVLKKKFNSLSSTALVKNNFNFQFSLFMPWRARQQESQQRSEEEGGRPAEARLKHPERGRKRVGKPKGGRLGMQLP